MALLLACWQIPARAERGPRGEPSKADTSRAAREDAIQAIPLAKLTPEGRQKVQWTLANTSVFRRLPTRMIQCDPDLYLFLLDHPDVVVNVWEVLGVSHLTMRQTGPGVFQATDDIGTAGTIECLYRTADLHVFFVDGTYTGSMFGHRVRGRGLMVLKSGYVREDNGKQFIVSRLDSFLNIEPGGAEFLTKTFQPAVGKVADANFLQTTGFLACLSRTAEVNNRGMQRLAEKLTKVQPEVRQRFAQLSDQVAQRAAQSPTAQTAEPILPEAGSNPRTAGAAPGPEKPIRR
jgi:hypothetical protein